MTIRKQPSGVSPTIELTINGAEVRYHSLTGIELLLEENHHDMLKIRMNGIPTRAVTEYRNAAVLLKLDTGAGYLDTFHGYVEKVVPTSKISGGLMNGSPFQDATLICLGASYAMRGAKSKVWDGYKLEDVAQTLAKSYSFSLDVPRDVLVYKKMIQRHESDWQFLVRYAGLLGYSVTCHGTHLHVFDPFKAASRTISFNKLLTTKATKMSMRPHPGMINEFRGEFKEDHPDGVYKDTVVTVMQDDGTQYDVSTRELKGITKRARFENRVTEPVDNYQEAVRVIEADAKNHYDYEATVTVVGMLGTKPGGVVDLDNYAAEYDGLWYVSKVHHMISSSGAFLTTLDLKRNINSELEQRSSTPNLVSVPGSDFDPNRNKWITRRNQYRVY